MPSHYEAFMNKSSWARMSFIDKVRWRNLHPIMNSWYFADKILAKDIARQRAPECKTARILQIPEKLQDIDIRTLPKDYVFKANHGSGWYIKVKDGRNVSTGENVTNSILIEAAKDWLSRICSWGNEKQYIPITPRIFFEEYLGEIQEVRCFCFDGAVKFIMVDIALSGAIKSTIYDRNWKRIHAQWRDPRGSDIAKPKNLPKLIRIADELAAGIDFVRIDMYIKGNDVYFGEFTFTPNGGQGSITPLEFDRLWGSYWTHDMAKELELKIPTGVKKISSSRLYMNVHMNASVLVRGVKYALRKCRNLFPKIA